MSMSYLIPPIPLGMVRSTSQPLPQDSPSPMSRVRTKHSTSILPPTLPTPSRETLPLQHTDGKRPRSSSSPPALARFIRSTMRPMEGLAPSLTDLLSDSLVDKESEDQLESAKLCVEMDESSRSVPDTVDNFLKYSSQFLTPIGLLYLETYFIKLGYLRHQSCEHFTSNSTILQSFLISSYFIKAQELQDSETQRGGGGGRGESGGGSGNGGWHVVRGSRAPAESGASAGRLGTGGGGGGREGRGGGREGRGGGRGSGRGGRGRGRGRGGASPLPSLQAARYRTLAETPILVNTPPFSTPPRSTTRRIDILRGPALTYAENAPSTIPPYDPYETFHDGNSATRLLVHSTRKSRLSGFLLDGIRPHFKRNELSDGPSFYLSNSIATSYIHPLFTQPTTFPQKDPIVSLVYNVQADILNGERPWVKDGNEIWLKNDWFMKREGGEGYYWEWEGEDGEWIMERFEEVAKANLNLSSSRVGQEERDRMGPDFRIGPHCVPGTAEGNGRTGAVRILSDFEGREVQLTQVAALTTKAYHYLNSCLSAIWEEHRA